MTDYIELCICKGFLTQQHGDDIIQMCNNVTIYDYDDVITNELTIIKNEFEVVCKKMNCNKLGPFFDFKGYHKTTFSYNNFILKTMTIDHNLMKSQQDAIIMVFFKEIYFHKVTREAILTNNIEHVIVPELLQYGKIVLENNDIIIFYKTIKYTDEQPPIFNNAKTEPIKFINEMKRVSQIKYRTLKACNDLLNRLNIYHNDMNLFSDIDDSYFERELYNITDRTTGSINIDYINSKYYNEWVDCIINTLHYQYDIPCFYCRRDNYYNDLSNNIIEDTNFFKYNDNYVLIDFEHAGDSDNIITLVEYLTSTIYPNY